MEDRPGGNALHRPWSYVLAPTGRRIALQRIEGGQTGDSDHPFKAPDQADIYQEAGSFFAGLKIMGERPHYTIVIEPLSDEDGGGFLATVPDLPGCMSDGETEFEAVQNIQDAVACWIEAAQENHQPVPAPTLARRATAGRAS